MAYLYGVSIQGIQGFIFETNKLREVVGASNLIEAFTSAEEIEKFAEKCEYEILRNAGGNIRLLFEDNQETLLKDFVSGFPQYLMQKAYGITISQAVVKFEKGNYLAATQELELKLKNARNQSTLPLDSKFALMKQTPRTGKPAFIKVTKNNEEQVFDKGSWQKDQNAEPARKNLLLSKIGIKENDYGKFPLQLSQISNSKNKIAVIHADGNKMGLLLQQMAEKLKDKDDTEIQQAYKEFSIGIEKATQEAVRSAFEMCFNMEKYDKSKVPFRPVVIGGDDVTVICDANKALNFVSKYMKSFQSNTKVELANLVKTYELKEFNDGLTACAGVAYSNEKFPFHYAADVAESLCNESKTLSNRDSSCLLFRNIQGSFYSGFKEYKTKELTAKETSFLYGPYYIREEDKKTPLLNDLETLYELMHQKDFPLGKLREWLTELHYSNDYAKTYLERVDVIAERNRSALAREINTSLEKLESGLSLKNLIVDNKTPIYDILQLKAVQGGK